MKQIVVIVGVITCLTGCISSPKRMDISDFNRYQVDCEYAGTQRVFVETQMPTRNDRINSFVSTSGPVGVVNTMIEGSFEQHMATRSGEYTAVARYHQDRINRCDHNYVNPNVCDLAFPESAACQNLRR